MSERTGIQAGPPGAVTAVESPAGEPRPEPTPGTAGRPAFAPQRTPVDVDRSRIAENILTVFYKGSLATAERVFLAYAFNRSGSEDLAEPEPEIEMSARPDGFWEANVRVPPAGDAHNLLFLFRDARSRWDDNEGRKWKLYLDLFRVPQVIDAHVHAHTERYLAPLHLRMETYFVDRALACTPNPEMVQGNPRLAGVYFCAPPAEEDLGRVRAVLDQGFVGIKFHPTADRFRVDEPVIHKFVDLAAERGVPVQFHTAADAYGHPKMVLKLARRFPGAKLHMVHMGMHISWGRNGHEEAIRAAKQAENLYLGISWAEFPWVERAITQVGVERVLFESDAPVGTTLDDDRRHDYRHYFNNIQQLNLSLGQLRKLVAGNTASLYRLAGGPPAGRL